MRSECSTLANLFLNCIIVAEQIQAAAYSGLIQPQRYQIFFFRLMTLLELMLRAAIILCIHFQNCEPRVLGLCRPFLPMYVLPPSDVK